MSLPLIPNNFNYYSLNAGIPAYLIPESGTVLTHVNATDLHNETAKVGGAWMQNGTVTFNSGATPNPSVGPFSDSNYFSQTSSSPANIGPGPWTVVVLFNPTSLTNEPVIFGTGPGGSTGYFLECFSSFVVTHIGGGAVQTSNAPVLNTLNVAIFGVDSSGNTFISLNGGTTALGSGSTTTSSVSSMIGRYTSATGFSFDGTIYEVMVSTAVPSSAAFTAIYNAVIANTLG